MGTSIFDLSSINENKKYTAKFDNYEAKNFDGEIHICAVLEEGKLPDWREGYDADASKLLTSLCDLYRHICEADEEAACYHIIEWCKKYSFPYYTKITELHAYDWYESNDTEHWDFWVNCLEMYTFPLNGMISDLKRLYEDTEILLYFIKVREGTADNIRLPQSDRAQPYQDIVSLKELDLLKILDSFLAEFPKFPLELCIDENADLKILPSFASVFDAAYFALARFAAADIEGPSFENGATAMEMCECCGKIFIKRGNRQKYCDDPECKKERNRRKSRKYYKKQGSEQK